LCQFGKQNVSFKWLDVAYQERDLGLPSLKTDFLSIPCAPIFVSPSW
jgi:hypothetical protein